LQYSDVTLTIQATLSGIVYRAMDGNYHESVIDDVEIHSLWIGDKEYTETELIAQFGIQGCNAIKELLFSQAEDWE
jgi:hypothetical protein